MSAWMPGLIMGFREGLEAFLVVMLALQYLKAIGQSSLKRMIWQGAGAGVLISFGVGILLTLLAGQLGGADRMAKVWESAASLLAMGLVTTFIVWMIRHGRTMSAEIKEQINTNLSAAGVFALGCVVVAREGAEVAIFSFAGKYAVTPVLAGIALALVFTFMIYYSIVRVRLDILFQVTLAYLILQAGYILGYGVHEGLSALKAYGILGGDHWLYAKVFDLSGSVLNHKEGWLGVPLNISLGWYSKPEWVQLVMQLGYLSGLFAFWWRDVSRENDLARVATDEFSGTRTGREDRAGV